MTRYDEYGQLVETKHKEWGIKVNLLAISGLWRKIRGPKKNDIDKRLAEAKRRDAEWEAMFAKPTTTKNKGD
jgi:hypothetical protein